MGFLDWIGDAANAAYYRRGDWREEQARQAQSQALQLVREQQGIEAVKQQIEASRQAQRRQNVSEAFDQMKVLEGAVRPGIPTLEAGIGPNGPVPGGVQTPETWDVPEAPQLPEGFPLTPDQARGVIETRGKEAYLDREVARRAKEGAIASADAKRRLIDLDAQWRAETDPIKRRKLEADIITERNRAALLGAQIGYTEAGTVQRQNNPTGQLTERDLWNLGARTSSVPGSLAPPEASAIATQVEEIRKAVDALRQRNNPPGPAGGGAGGPKGGTPPTPKPRGPLAAPTYDPNALVTMPPDVKAAYERIAAGRRDPADMALVAKWRDQSRGAPR